VGQDGDSLDARASEDGPKDISRSASREKAIDRQFLTIHGSLHPGPNDEKYLSSTTDAARSFAALMKYQPELRKNGPASTLFHNGGFQEITLGEWVLDVNVPRPVAPCWFSISPR